MVQTLLVLISLMVYIPAVGAYTIMPGPYLINNTTELSGEALSGAQGIIGVNMAAGTDNFQVNARVIGIGTIPSLSIRQDMGGRVYGLYLSCHLDYIGGNALSGSTGIISVNQASGSGAIQANLVSIGVGTSLMEMDLAVASSEELLSIRGGGRPGGYGPVRSDVIEGSAFAGVNGLVQVNQSAGSGNRVVNSVGILFDVINK